MIAALFRTAFPVDRPLPWEVRGEGWQNGRMSSPDGGANDDTNDVLSSLPRSRRQRPTARREAARAHRAGASPAPRAKGVSARKAEAGSKAAATKPKAGAGSKAPAAKPTTASAATGPKALTKATAVSRKAGSSAAVKAGTKRPLSPSAKRASDLPRVRPPRSAIPPAGYATPVTNRGDRGSADPGAAIGRLAGAGASALRSVLKRLPL